MHFDSFSFRSIQIDGTVYEHDVIIDRGEIRKRRKKPSKKFQQQFGHTPLSIEEEIPWKCRQLVVGNGAYGRLPVMQEVRREAEPQDQIARLAHPRSHRGIEARAQRHECRSSRDLLTVGIFISGTWPFGQERDEAPLILGLALNVWEIVGQELRPRRGIPPVVDYAPNPIKEVDVHEQAPDLG